MSTATATATTLDELCVNPIRTPSRDAAPGPPWAGHPEYGGIFGIEATTGPAGLSGGDRGGRGGEGER